MRLYEPDGDDRYLARGPDSTRVVALVGRRIVAADRKSPLDFFAHYLPRQPFEVPSGPGVCVPYATITGETDRASVGASLRLRDRPEIVIHVRDGADPTAPARPASARALLERAVSSSLDASRSFVPLDGRSSPFQSIVIDGRKGEALFGRVTRDLPAEVVRPGSASGDGEDWVFVAAVLRHGAGRADDPADAVLIVERYSGLATRRMPEQEFRALANEVAASVRRRPGAHRPR